MRVKIFEKPLIFAEFFSFKLTKKQQHNAAYELLSYMMKKYYKTDDAAVLYDEKGKPYFENYPQIHFSISHNRKAVCAAIYEKNIGVDIEEIKKHSTSVVSRTFTQNEINHILNISDEKKDEYFFKIWTLKESVVKLDGRGLSYGLKNIDIDIDNKKIIPELDFGQKNLSGFIVSYAAEK